MYILHQPTEHTHANFIHSVTWVHTANILLQITHKDIGLHINKKQTMDMHIRTDTYTHQHS